MEKVRIGVVGLRFGLQHVRTLANIEEAQLVAVADLTADQLNPYARKYGAKPYRDGLEMLEQEELDAVSLCVSPRDRALLVEAVARKGIPMLIEKPWATNLEHAHRLAEICRKHNATVMTAFSFRFHPAVVKLRALIDGALGEPWMLSADYVFSWVPPAEYWLWDPENGNGFFNENSCHLFDVICYMLGDPVSVMAEAINPMAMPSENAAAVTVRFAGGAIASLTIGGIATDAFHHFPRIDVVTANGQARLSGRNHIWEQLDWATRDSDVVHNIIEPPEALGTTRYTHGLRHFCECVRDGQKPSVGVEEGVRTVAMAMAVYESARTGAKVLLDY